MRRAACVFSVALPVLAASAATGCAASGTTERARDSARHGELRGAYASYQRSHDRALLRAIAAGLLEHDALSPDARSAHAAFSEIAAAGDKGRALLLRLNTDGTPARVRALALCQLSALGDGLARSELRALVSVSDQEIVDLAYGALDVARDRALLVAALSATRTERRLAALHVLAHAEPQPTLAAALSERAQLDPATEARVAALRALEAQGPGAAPSVLRVLEDPSEPVRLAAIAALPRLDVAAAEQALSRWLSGEPSAESIEAARALLTAHAAHEAVRAARVLSLALEASSSALRGRAATTLRALPLAERDQRAVKERLERETVPEIRLLLALALAPSDSQVRATFLSLSKLSSVTGSQAALELARLGDETGLTVLRSLVASPVAAVRSSAARALGHELDHPEDIAALLLDEDPGVRRSAAGALLAND